MREKTFPNNDKMRLDGDIIKRFLTLTELFIHQAPKHLWRKLSLMRLKKKAAGKSSPSVVSHCTV